MKNNDILRRLRYAFDFNDTQMIKLFGFGGQEVTRAEVSDWLKKDDDPDFKAIYDKQLAVFLNGFIVSQRGAKEEGPPKNEKSLNNNLILRKLRIALSLDSDDMIGVFELGDIKVSKHEISAFFRNPDQRQYRECHDQYLRHFLKGLQERYREE